MNDETSAGLRRIHAVVVVPSVGVCIRPVRPSIDFEASIFEHFFLEFFFCCGAFFLLFKDRR